MLEPQPLESFLQAERAALADARPAAHVALLEGPAISLGAATDRSGALAATAASMGLAVIRRSTGGEAVVHGAGDVAWSLVLPRHDPRVGHDFTRAYGRLGRAAAEAFRAMHVEATWVAPLAVHPSLCLLGPRGSVLVVDHRVIGGAAQHLTRSAILHHGIITGALDRAPLRALFALTDGEIDRHLTSLADLRPPVDARAFGDRLAVALDRFVAEGIPAPARATDSTEGEPPATAGPPPLRPRPGSPPNRRS